MKKSLFFYAAAAALMLTACSSEDDILQTGPEKEVVPQEVGFDVFVPATTTTRAGYKGTLTTSRLQDANAGFGIYAFYSDQLTKEDNDGDYGYANLNTSYIPNFMWNEKILWNSTNQGWEYAPLKYWPNETVNDSQTNPDPAYMERNGSSSKRLDRLTFFAYAPHVSTPSSPGITAITANDGKLTPTIGTGDALTAITTDPSVEYKAAFTTGNGAIANTDPNNGVDLLWGVAPSGDLTYTAVNGQTVNKKEGLPLIDMTKPDVNTNMKFLFEHALARFGVKVAAAIDQVAQGGELDPNTKITIKSVKLTGYLGETGILNLNNGKQNTGAAQPVGAHNANWMRFNGVDLTSDLNAASFLIAGNKRTIVISGDNIAPHLLFKNEDGHFYPTNLDAQKVVGVTTALQDLITPSTEFRTKLAGVPTYDPAKPYYTTSTGGSVAQAKCANGTKIQKGSEWGFLYTESSGTYTKQNSDVLAPAYPEHIYGAVSTLYDVTAKEHKVTEANTKPSDLADTDKIYERTGTGTEADPYVYTYSEKEASAYTWGAVDTKAYTLTAKKLPVEEVPYKYADGTYYSADRNFFMVVPTHNILNNLASPWTTAQEQALNTITVEIEYYVTTEDSKLNAQRSQIKNVITKNVVLPHIKNGQSYNLNLILGLTSVKVEAEVDDWKVTNVNGYLPQNTAGE